MNVGAELLARLLAAAIRYSGLPAVDLADLPPIEPVSATVLSEKVCPDSPERCTTVAALFDTENYRIYLRDTLKVDEPMDNSFIVHELVHVLQFRKFGDANFGSCRKRIASEQQAYYVQNNYLGEEGIRTGPTWGSQPWMITKICDLAGQPPRADFSSPRCGS
jgi:hypothetical protein